VPQGWVVDGAGEAVTDHNAAMEYVFKRKEGGITPLGGPEETGGHKGYGLGLMVHILAGTLVGRASRPSATAASALAQLPATASQRTGSPSATPTAKVWAVTTRDFCLTDRLASSPTTKAVVANWAVLVPGAARHRERAPAHAGADAGALEQFRQVLAHHGRVVDDDDADAAGAHRSAPLRAPLPPCASAALAGAGPVPRRMLTSPLPSSRRSSRRATPWAPAARALR